MSEQPFQRIGNFVYQLTPDGRGKLVNRWSANVNHDNKGATDATAKDIEGVAQLFVAAPSLLAACKALLEAARNIRGEVVVTGELTAATLEPMFAADDLAQAAISKAEGATECP
jgi:hypothetical protein